MFNKIFKISLVAILFLGSFSNTGANENGSAYTICATPIYENEIIKESGGKTHINYLFDSFKKAGFLTSTQQDSFFISAIGAKNAIEALQNTKTQVNLADLYAQNGGIPIESSIKEGVLIINKSTKDLKKIINEDQNCFVGIYADTHQVWNVEISQIIEQIITDESPSFKVAESGIADYTTKSLEQIIYGNYTDEITLAGTIGQVATGFLGIDLPGDLRDIYYDLSHYEFTWEHNQQLAIDTIGLLPIIGALKYSDEVSDLVKAGKKAKKGTKATIKNTKAIQETIMKKDLGGAIINGKIEIPKDWIKQPSKTGKGFVYKDPNNPNYNNIRLMNIDSSGKGPWIKVMKDGSYINKNGEKVLKNSNEAHQLIKLINYE